MNKRRTLLRLAILGVVALLIWSYVSASASLPLPDRSVVARCKTGDSFVTVLGVHAPPPTPACDGTNDPTIVSICDWIDHGRLNRDVGPGRKGDFCVIAGDLNSFPFEGSMNCFAASGLADAADSATTWRFATTWSPTSILPAMIRIDYIFHPEALRVSDCWTVSLPGSDHRAVIADVVCL